MEDESDQISESTQCESECFFQYCAFKLPAHWTCTEATTAVTRLAPLHRMHAALT